MDVYFYYINNDYINFLKKYENEHLKHTCVPNVQYKTSDKFMFGAVMNINDMDYFVPVSSYDKSKEDVILIRDKKNKSNILGSLRFAYMLPVPHSCLVKLDINAVSNAYSKVHISKELAFCRRERDKIFKQAQKTYFRVTNKVDEQLVKNSCDFKLLEKAYMEYCIANKLECPQADKQNNLSNLSQTAHSFTSGKAGGRDVPADGRVNAGTAEKPSLCGNLHRKNAQVISPKRNSQNREQDENAKRASAGNKHGANNNDTNSL